MRMLLLMAKEGKRTHWMRASQEGVAMNKIVSMDRKNLNDSMVEE